MFLGSTNGLLRAAQRALKPLKHLTHTTRTRGMLRACDSTKKRLTAKCTWFPIEFCCHGDGTFQFWLLLIAQYTHAIRVHVRRFLSVTAGFRSVPNGKQFSCFADPDITICQIIILLGHVYLCVRREHKDALRQAFVVDGKSIWPQVVNIHRHQGTREGINPIHR